MPSPSKILVVDDHPVARQVFESVLFDQPYEVRFANSGAEGLEIAFEWLPDVILLDVMMPGMDGFEVCRRLRDRRQLAEVPVVMITALDDRESRLRGIESGADDFLSKPIDRSEILARLRNLSRLNRFRRLCEERARSAWVLGRSDHGYVTVDRTGHLTYANARARLYLGIATDTEVPSVDFFELAQKTLRPVPAESWQDWPSFGPHTKKWLVRCQTESSPEFWLQMQVLVSNDESIGNVIELQDVTGELTAQRDVRKFHDAMTHKFRTPLVHLHGGLDILASDADTLPRSEIAKFAEIALSGVERLQSQIQQVLLYTREPILAEADDRFPLAQLGALVGRTVKELGVDATLEICDELQAERALVSEAVSEFLLREVLGNAKKFHPRGNPQVTVSAQLYGNSALLTIQDDGLHLAPQQLTNLLRPYEQSHRNADSGETPGLGLGLSTVSSLLWGIGGDVRIYNRSDSNGITVDLVIPLETAQGEGAAGVTSASA